MILLVYYKSKFTLPSLYDNIVRKNITTQSVVLWDESLKIINYNSKINILLLLSLHFANVCTFHVAHRLYRKCWECHFLSNDQHFRPPRVQSRRAGRGRISGSGGWAYKCQMNGRSSERMNGCACLVIYVCTTITDWIIIINII